MESSHTSKIYILSDARGVFFTISGVIRFILRKIMNLSGRGL